MAINLYNIKRWYKMLSGKSVYHVNQNIGQMLSISELKGYYNDFTEKVLKGDETLVNGLPILIHIDGSVVQFPIAIFQYGLGAYDLWLLSEKKNKVFYEKFCLCANWALNNQLDIGAWDNFSYVYPNNPYSAMAQGEGASLLLRMYKESKDEKWFVSSRKAIDFMLTPLSEGGTMKKTKQGKILLEYTHLDIVLNGWIFAIFGIYDLLKFTHDKKYTKAYEETIAELVKILPEFDCGYWSMYDANGKIASPFYHNLHIELMKAMFILTNNYSFQFYAIKWQKYSFKFWKRSRAFIYKCIQKIIE